MLELLKRSFDKCVQIGRPFSARQPLPAHEFFKASGFFCVAESDGPQGLSLIDLQSLAPVLFDIGLPTSDGSEILRFVRQKSPHIPVILMIGFQLADLPQLLAESPETR